MAKQALLVLNAHAGKNSLRSHLLNIIDLFVKEGWNVNVHPTQCPKDAVHAAAAMTKECDLLLVSGGDGTLSEVVTGLMCCQKRPVIGYLPEYIQSDY